MEEMTSLTGNSTASRNSIPRKPVASVRSGHPEASPSRPLDYAEITEDDGDHYDSPRRRRVRDARDAVAGTVNRYWLLEILSCALALVALAAIVITLATHQGRPLPQWPLRISINTLIAVFTAILKAAMLVPIQEGISQLKWLWYSRPRTLIDLNQFDKASRGPWGSLLLLSRPAKHYLATLGALITVIAIAIDPFSQQIIKYYSCLQVEPDATTWISRTNNYTAGGFHTGAATASLDGPMTVAIYQGLIDPPANASASIHTSCSTGNCTFPSDNGVSYSSMAMCHSCSDVSDSIKGENRTFGYTLPIGYTGAFIGGDVVLNTTYISGFNESLFSFASVMIITQTNQPWAVRCSIHPCLKTYGANVTQSVLEERELSSTPLIFANDLVVGGGEVWYSMSTEKTVRDGAWVDCNPSQHYSVDTPVAVVTANKTIAPGPYLDPQFAKAWPLDVLSFYPSDCVYYLDFTAVISLSDFLLNLFDRNSLASDTGATVDAAGDLWIQDLYLNGTANLTTANAYMKGLTDSMTATIRSRGVTPISGYAQGTTFGVQTCIGVRWGWIALPASLVLLMIIFLGATVLQTAAQGGRPWKSSPLALIFHGLNDEVRGRYGALNSVKEMEDSAKMIRARLGPTDGGWNLVEAKP